VTSSRIGETDERKHLAELCISFTYEVDVQVLRYTIQGYEDNG
jgi:hypothetical protein